jgi:hypothetical protein
MNTEDYKISQLRLFAKELHNSHSSLSVHHLAGFGGGLRFPIAFALVA